MGRLADEALRAKVAEKLDQQKEMIEALLSRFIENRDTSRVQFDEHDDEKLARAFMYAASKHMAFQWGSLQAGFDKDGLAILIENEL